MENPSKVEADKPKVTEIKSTIPAFGFHSSTGYLIRAVTYNIKEKEVRKGYTE